MQQPQPTRRQLVQSVLALCAGLGLAACEPRMDKPSSARFKGIDLTGATYGRTLALTDAHGQPRSLQDFKGQVVLLYFGFAQCPDVCPTALTRAVEVKQKLGTQADKLQVIFVTVDPERDTPEMLREYMAAFDPSFMALMGNAEQTKTAADEFRVYYKKVPTGSSYTMDHTALSYVFDTQGHLRVALRHEQTAADYAADIQTLLSEASAPRKPGASI